MAWRHLCVIGWSWRFLATITDCGLSRVDAQVTLSTIKVTIIVIVVTVEVCDSPLTCCDWVAVYV
jgi:hypothetical protein